MRKATALILVILSYCGMAIGQTLGGQAVYNFLKLPATPMLTAAGGVNVSYAPSEVGMSANQPALLHAALSSQLNVSFNGLPGGIKGYSLTGALHRESLNTTFGGHIYFVNYGSQPQTDAAGNTLGEFRPVDYVVQLSAARIYLEKWRYGASLKLIRSSYGVYSSTGIALDLGVHYSDTAKKFSAGMLFRNMGAQLKTYAGEGEDLPFDVQVGLTKRLAKAPLGFSLSAQQLHHFDILYNDTVFNNANEQKVSTGFFNKLVNHFVVATHIYAGQHLEATVGYNRLRRSELNIGSAGNGLNGFSIGLRATFLKFQVLYARAHYQKNVAYNQIGITLHMKELLGKNL